MGAGGSQEAEWTLVGDVPAGTWHLVADGIIAESVDVTFELLWRKAAGGDDVTIARWDHHFDPGADFNAQAYEVSADGPAINYDKGDQLIFRYTGNNSTSPMAYIPNGDGMRKLGRIPYIDLPQ